MVAIAALPVLHVPPAVVSDNVVVLPTHTEGTPRIVPAEAPEITDKEAVATAVPQLVERV
jgi:hypothetical protein